MPTEAKQSMPDTIVFVVTKTLSDGSEVFDVMLGGNTWAAVSKNDAEELAEKIADAINDHTNNTADVVYD